MRLSGPSRQQLLRALLSTFNRESLTEMLSVMDVKLDEIAGGTNFRAVVFNVIDWSEAQGRLDEFLTQARTSNPDNPALRTFTPQYVDPPAVPSGTGVDAGTLRRAIAGAFNADDLDLLCADVQDALKRRGIDLVVSVEESGGSGRSLSVRVLNLIGYLDRRGYLPDLVDAVRRARPGLV